MRITQPSLSRAIKDLEATLGVSLFVRTQRSVRLTDAGRALLDEAPHAMAAVDRCVTAARRAGSGEIGSLSVGFLPSVTAVLLPQVVTAFRSARPDVHLELREMLDDPLLEALETGQVDVGILRLGADSPGLSVERLFDDPVCAVLPARHRLARRKRVEYADLRDEPFVLWPRNQSRQGHDAIMAACRDSGFTPRVVQECALPYTILGLVAAGVGVSVLSGLFSTFRSDAAFVPLGGAEGTLYLAWRTARPSATRDAFIQLVRDSFVTSEPTRARPARASAARSRSR